MESIKFALFVTVLLIAATGGVLFVWGDNDGQYTEEGSVRVPGSPDTVFDWLADANLRERWVEELVDSRQEGFGALEPGSKLVEAYKGRIEDLVWEVLAAERGRSFAIKTTRDDVVLTLRYRVKTHNSGRQSLVTLTVEAQYEGWWPKLIEPITGGKLFEEFRSQLDKLAAQDLQT